MEDDIYPSYVQQVLFGKSYFWFSSDFTPGSYHLVFPIESFRDIFACGFKEPVDSYITNLAYYQIDKCKKLGSKPGPRLPKLNKIFIESDKDFTDKFYLPNKDRKDYVAWDLETSGLNFTKDKIGCITLSFDGVNGYYIPWRFVDKTKLNEILSHCKQIGANLKFDCKMLWYNGVPAARIDEDVITIGHTLDETRSNSLKALAYFYSEYGGYERPLDQIKDKIGKGKNINYIEDIPEDVLREYAVMDAIVTYRVWKNILAHMRELDKKYPNMDYPGNSLEYFYRHNRIPADNLYAGCEFRGVPVDKPMLDSLRKEISKYRDHLKEKLSDAFSVSKDFNWDSSVQIGKLLEKKGWECLGRSKSGDYLTGKFQMKRWAKEHEEASIIMELGSISTLISTFVGEDTSNSVVANFLGINDEKSSIGWTKCMNYWPDKKMYGFNPSFASLRADSNRSRCTNPNMQQVPTRGKFTKEIKKCIMSPNDDDYYIVTLDYSSLQMRLAAMDSDTQDDLKTVLRKPGADIHSQTAWNTFYKNKEVDVLEVTVGLEEESQNKKYLGGEEVLTSNRGIVFASDLKNDDLIDNKKIQGIRMNKVHREITTEEFIRQKTSNPYKNQRQTSKSLNFLLVFGGSAHLFSEQALELSWTPEQVDEFLEENHCFNELEQVKRIYKNDDIIKQKYTAAATRMRDNFFKGYKGLLDRLSVQENLAKKNGYVRSVFGGKRAAIELMLEGEYDEKARSNIISGLTRILYNYRAQNYEASITKRAMYEVETWLEKNNYKSRMFSEIHDSQDMFLYKKELSPVLAHWKHVCERKIPELEKNWCPLPVDCEIADRSKGDYYKGGREPEEFGIDWDTIQFEDPDPFNVELKDSFEKEYFEKRLEYWTSKEKKDPLQEKIDQHLKRKGEEK